MKNINLLFPHKAADQKTFADKCNWLTETKMRSCFMHMMHVYHRIQQQRGFLNEKEN